MEKIKNKLKARITHRELCEAGASWLLKCVNWKFKCPQVLIEFCSTAQENPDIFGLRGSHSICIEVKVSRADFKADEKKRHRQSKGIGLTRYYLVPEGLISPNEIENNWGLIYYKDKSFTVIKESEVFEDRDFNSELTLLQSVIRRLGGSNKILDFRKQS